MSFENKYKIEPLIFKADIILSKNKNKTKTVKMLNCLMENVHKFTKLVKEIALLGFWPVKFFTILLIQTAHTSITILSSFALKLS